MKVTETELRTIITESIHKVLKEAIAPRFNDICANIAQTISTNPLLMKRTLEKNSTVLGLKKEPNFVYNVLYALKDTITDANAVGKIIRTINKYSAWQNVDTIITYLNWSNSGYALKNPKYANAAKKAHAACKNHGGGRVGMGQDASAMTQDELGNSRIYKYYLALFTGKLDDAKAMTLMNK